LVVNMAPQPLGRVFNASGKTVHGIRVEMRQTAKRSRSSRVTPKMRRC
jgi:predicted RNA-binding protein YlqC (UPF0109 family)